MCQSTLCPDHHHVSVKSLSWSSPCVSPLYVLVTMCQSTLSWSSPCVRNLCLVRLSLSISDRHTVWHYTLYSSEGLGKLRVWLCRCVYCVSTSSLVGMFGWYCSWWCYHMKSLSVCVCFLSVFAMLGMLSPASRGALMTASIFLFMFMG